jgi:HD-like signal output (HDOD) protein
MNSSVSDRIRTSVEKIETTPTVPAVFLPLLNMLSTPANDTKLDEIVRLVSYDSMISAQCLRVARSPLFGLAHPPKSIAGAVMALGLRRVEAILLTCCMSNAFPSAKWALDPSTFWKHSLGCAMVCRRISERLACAGGEKAYMAGLLHDLGFVVNCTAFPKEFASALAFAQREGIPLDRAEQHSMGFTHCDTGVALAEKWDLADDLVEAIGRHHCPDKLGTAQDLVAIVHLSDLLCRMRGLGYGYYENLKVSLADDPSWAVLLATHPDLGNLDVVRFTFELDEAVTEISETVGLIFGGSHRN